MPQSKRRGRPKKQSDGVDKSSIFTCALSMIETRGLEHLSFRTLAAELGVTAMAVSYHVGSRDQMLSDLTAQVFADVASSVPNGTHSAELRHYLARYCELALQNADLVRFMLTKPDSLPNALQEFTAQIRLRTQAINDGDIDDVMLNLLIDYVHGFVFSADAAPTEICLTLEDCMKSVDWLMAVLESEG